MDGVKWIKIQTDIFDNDKIIAIEDMPEGDSLLVVWFKLLAIAGKCNKDGMILLTSDIPYTESLLANRFRKPLNIIQLALTTFVRLHMIEIVDDIIMVSNWEHYQNTDKLAEIREYNRLAKQKSREKQKKLSIEEESTKEEDNIINKDIDKEYIDIEEVNDMSKTCQKPRQKKDSLNDVLNGFVLHEEVKEALIDFIAMRKEKKRPLTARALKMVINKLRDLSSDRNTQVEIINQSILHNWDTVYELKDNYNKYQYQNNKNNQIQNTSFATPVELKFEEDE